jgi:hypothetical protein
MPSSFFEEYAPYQKPLLAGQFSEAINGALRLLSGVKQLSPSEYQAAHKGTPFYVMGFAAFASHDYETASFLFDAAVAEDQKNFPDKRDTPALRFMQLDDGNPDQLAIDIVKLVKSKTTELIREYNGRAGAQTLTFNDVRSRFLNRILVGQPHTRTLITTFISFIAEWHYRTLLIDLSNDGSREPFFMHLFKGCLLFESLLKENPSKVPQQRTLGRILERDLATELAIGQVDVRPEQDFGTMVGGLVPNMSVQDSIESTGKARNTLGHNIVWTTTGLTPETYGLLARNIATACIHAISKLYP